MMSTNINCHCLLLMLMPACAAAAACFHYCCYTAAILLHDADRQFLMLMLYCCCSLMLLSCHHKQTRNFKIIFGAMQAHCPNKLLRLYSKSLSSSIYIHKSMYNLLFSAHSVIKQLGFQRY